MKKAGRRLIAQENTQINTQKELRCWVNQPQTHNVSNNIFCIEYKISDSPAAQHSKNSSLKFSDKGGCN